MKDMQKENAAILLNLYGRQDTSIDSIDHHATHLFHKEMAAKLKVAHKKGRTGWWECPSEYLEEQLKRHIEKGDMRDVANLAMFIHYRKAMEE